MSTEIWIGPVYSREDYADFIRRTIALLIDFFPFLLLYSIAPDLWYEFGPPEWVTLESYLQIEFGIYLAGLLYNVAFRMTPGGTIGYRLLRIRYAYMLNQKPAWYILLYRSAIAVFLLLSFSLDHIWILFDARKQAWHDKMSGFYVVKCGARPIGTQRIVRRIVNFMMLSLVVWEPAADDDARPAIARRASH